MSAEPTIAEMLGIEPESRVWIVGDSVEETALLDPLPEGVELFQDEEPEVVEGWFDDTWTGAQHQREPVEPPRPTDVDTAVVAVSNTHEFHMRLDDALPRMGSVDRVWIVFPPHEVPLQIVRNGVDEYGWEAGETLTLDDTWAAVSLDHD